MTPILLLGSARAPASLSARPSTRADFSLSDASTEDPSDVDGPTHLKPKASPSTDAADAQATKDAVAAPPVTDKQQPLPLAPAAGAERSSQPGGTAPTDRAERRDGFSPPIMAASSRGAKSLDTVGVIPAPAAGAAPVEQSLATANVSQPAASLRTGGPGQSQVPPTARGKEGVRLPPTVAPVPAGPSLAVAPSAPRPRAPDLAGNALPTASLVPEFLNGAPETVTETAAIGYTDASFDPPSETIDAANIEILGLDETDILLSLDTEHLGRVDLAVSLDDSGVSAQLLSEHRDSRATIDTAIARFDSTSGDTPMLSTADWSERRASRQQPPPPSGTERSATPRLPDSVTHRLDRKPPGGTVHIYA